MPPLPDVPNALRIDLGYYDGVANWGSRFFVIAIPGGGTASDNVALAGEVKGLWVDNMAPVVSADYALTSVKVTDLTTTTSPVGEWTGSEPGTIDDDALPSNVSSDMDIYINSRYRGGHPVMHFPPATAAQLATPRTWTDAFKTDFDTAADNFLAAVDGISDYGGGSIEWVVLRGYRPGATTGDVHAYQALSVTLRKYVGTMRRRARALR
jgi:hypothetical protein